MSNKLCWVHGLKNMETDSLLNGKCAWKVLLIFGRKKWRTWRGYRYCNESRVPVESKSAELLKLLRSKPNIIDDVKPTDIFSKLFAEANQLSMQFESELAFLHHGKEKLRNILSCSSSSQPHLLYCLQNQLELNNKTIPAKHQSPIWDSQYTLTRWPENTITKNR